MRSWIARGAVVLLLGGLAGLAWLTGHPDAQVVERATRWPGIGGWAQRFRDLYRPPPPPPPPLEAEREVEIVTIWMPARALPPAAGAPARGARPVERAAAPGAAPGAAPPLGRAVEPPRPLPARGADPERLRAAETLFGAPPLHTAVGPYAMVVESGIEPPLARWSALAGALDATFAERTGCAPLGEPAESVVLFGAESSYRALQGFETRLAGLATGGHASAGLAALWSAGRSPDEVESTLVHELVHFVSRRALGPALPPWLDEGLAEDLAQTPFDSARSRFALGAWRADVERSAGRVEIRGALAALDLAARALDAEPPLAVGDLLRLDWEGFVGSAAPVRYAQALAWVRFLLDGGDPARAARFREFLDGVARGESAAGTRLLDLLGGDTPELEASFAAWLRAERGLRYAVAGLPPGPTVQAPAVPNGSSRRQAAPPSP